MAPPRIISDLADLVLGRQCLGCGQSAPGVCPACLAGLRTGAAQLPAPLSPAPQFSSTDYSGLARRLIVAYKKQGYVSLASPLGWLLADSIWAAAKHCSLREPVVAPIPGHRRSRRGFDALGLIVDEAVRVLRAAGVPVRVERALVQRASYRELKGLGRTARRAEVAGAFSAGPGHLPSVILVDDVITTGATIAEACAALGRSSVRVDAVAVVAAVASPDRSATSRGPAPAMRRW